MCTIAGYWNEERISSAPLLSMMHAMSHRGPDAHGLSLDGEVTRSARLSDLKPETKSARIALGHSRLHIVGEEDFGQPYTSCDGRLQLIHNGEIYNYPELRALLGTEHRLRTTSDSEILVHLMEEAYRGDLLEAMRHIQPLLDGMYAIAVSDGKSIVLARDPAGKKPLYYTRAGGAWYFASEKKAVRVPGGILKSVEPGNRLVLDAQGPRQEKGVTLPYPQIDIDEFDEAVDLYKKAIAKAVRKRLRGVRESHVGVIFSGGIDSVLVAQLLREAGQNVTCYCTGEEGSGDLAAARQAAKLMDLDLVVQPLREESLAEIVPQIMHDVEERGLLQVEVAVPMYLAAEAASKDGIRVMFTGQAADELFAGYDWYRKVIAEHGYLRLHERLWEDIRALAVDTLEREDKLTMAHSIELRVPYLDLEVVHTAMRILPQLKIHGPEDRMRKHVHRHASLELGVPMELSFRRKDPAQSGSGIHGMMEALATRCVEDPCDERAAANVSADKGSLYRYDLGDYGTEVSRTYLERLAERVAEENPSPLESLT
jgi:asparagine synthase (glutamine-hydrolysing)